MMIKAPAAVMPWKTQLVTMNPKETAILWKNHKKAIPTRTRSTLVPLNRTYSRNKM